MKKWCAALAASMIVLSTAGCDAGGSDGPSNVVYNAQHEQLISEIAPDFTKKTGIKVELRNGSDSELAAQLEQEGDASPADVFLTENSPAMSQVERAGLLRRLPNSALAPIPAQYRPRSGLWTGFVARSPVLVYNTEKVKPSELPTSLMDLADPAWKGRVSFSPTGADFQAIVAAVLELKGEKATRAWLAGLKANGTTYDGNNVVLEAVNAGRSEVGIIYHYYWYRDQQPDGVPQQLSDSRTGQEVHRIAETELRGAPHHPAQRDQGHPGHHRSSEQEQRRRRRRPVPADRAGGHAQRNPASVSSFTTAGPSRSETLTFGGSSSSNGLTGGPSEAAELSGYSSA